MAKVLAALSGGVDSAVAVLLLKRAGHEVDAAYMKNWINEENILGDCPWEEDIRDAEAVAASIGVPFRVVNLMDQYRRLVVQYMIEGYTEGVTPNPDVMCNREIKFGAFLSLALSDGYDFVATGHYARVEHSAGGPSTIWEGRDKTKDQSYFLALLKQEQIRHALFPIGALLKSEVRSIAREANLPVADKKDSQGICFIGRVKMTDFLSTFVPDKPGDIVNVDGKIVGRHRGLHLYTLGQRRGLGVASNTMGKAYVVVAKDLPSNRLLVGFDEADTPGLHANESELISLSFTAEKLAGIVEIEAKPRYRAPRVPATLHVDHREGGDARISFAMPQRALSPGQICAFYRGEQMLGGSIFSKVMTSETGIGSNLR
jgi:tRNA-specific 2-thiouridylase